VELNLGTDVTLLRRGGRSAASMARDGADTVGGGGFDTGLRRKQPCLRRGDEGGERDAQSSAPLTVSEFLPHARPDLPSCWHSKISKPVNTNHLQVISVDNSSVIHDTSGLLEASPASGHRDYVLPRYYILADSDAIPLCVSWLSIAVATTAVVRSFHDT
jgi:hypothetical protein